MKPIWKRRPFVLASDHATATAARANGKGAAIADNYAQPPERLG